MNTRMLCVIHSANSLWRNGVLFYRSSLGGLGSGVCEGTTKKVQTCIRDLVPYVYHVHCYDHICTFAKATLKQMIFFYCLKTEELYILTSNSTVHEVLRAVYEERCCLVSRFPSFSCFLCRKKYLRGIQVTEQLTTRGLFAQSKAVSVTTAVFSAILGKTNNVSHKQQSKEADLEKGNVLFAPSRMKLPKYGSPICLCGILHKSTSCARNAIYRQLRGNARASSSAWFHRLGDTV